MRVLMLTKGLDVGGAERVVADLATHLVDNGHDVEIAVISGSRLALAPLLRSRGVGVVSLPGNDRVGLRGVLAVRRSLRRGKYDVVHAHGPAAIALAGRFSPRPVVGTVHGMWRALRPASRLAVRSSSHRVHLVAVSTTVRAALPSRLRANVTVIGHGVDIAAADRAAAAAATEAAATTLRLLTVASHRPEKNYGNLLQAVAHARALGADDLHLTAIGEGPRLAAHRALAARLGLAEIVSFEPPRPDVLRDIAGCDVFVLASDSEGQPIVVVEALACRRPVIATAVGRTPELVTADVGIVVPPGDPFTLGAAIAELAANPDRRAAMSAACDRIRDELSLDRALEAHLALYREVLS